VSARHLVVGDVHGCSEELEALLSLVADEGRELVLVGDIIAKGPDSRGVVERARKLGARGVVGNHDARGLAWYRAVRDGTTPPKRKKKHLAVYESLGERDWAWLDALPPFLRLDEHGVIVVHAGLLPDVPLDRQDPAHLMTMRSIRADGTPSEALEDGEPWAKLWPGPELVLFGHDAIRKLQRWPHAIGLDTGCVYGGELTGLLLPERELVSVPAKKTWLPPAEDE
jgi:diadenosine tetraphosphatase ApaH/serine/threonine PP2A family protein phosphatase